MVNTQDAQKIAALFYNIDSLTRNALCKKMIADERDYVSRLVTYFDLVNLYKISSNSLFTNWGARVNPSEYERLFGCDSMIVFKTKTSIKVGLFEAKLIKDKNSKWDYFQNKDKKKGSHFTSQIDRQAKWSHQATIWEMFFLEKKVGISFLPFDDFGSTCIRHEFAVKFNKSRVNNSNIWDSKDLKEMVDFEKNCTKEEVNLYEVIKDILIDTSADKTIKIIQSDTDFYLTPHDEEESPILKKRIKCPILSLYTENKSQEEKRLNRFMKRTGLSFFYQVNIEDESIFHS